MRMLIFPQCVFGLIRVFAISLGTYSDIFNASLREHRPDRRGVQAEAGPSLSS